MSNCRLFGQGERPVFWLASIRTLSAIRNEMFSPLMDRGRYQYFFPWRSSDVTDVVRQFCTWLEADAIFPLDLSHEHCVCLAGVMLLSQGSGDSVLWGVAGLSSKSVQCIYLTPVKFRGVTYLLGYPQCLSCPSIVTDRWGVCFLISNDVP